MWLLIVVFGDVFCSRDLVGSRRRSRVILVIECHLAVFVYLIARGHKMR